MASQPTPPADSQGFDLIAGLIKGNQWVFIHPWHIGRWLCSHLKDPDCGGVVGLALHLLLVCSVSWTESDSLFFWKGSDGLRIEFLIDMFSYKWSKMINLSCWPANLWSFDSFSTLRSSGHLPSQNWRVQSSSVQQGPFMCLALLQPWCWVSPRCLSGP